MGSPDAMQQTVLFGSRAAVCIAYFKFQFFARQFPANLVFIGCCESASVAFDNKAKFVVNVCCDTLIHFVLDVNQPINQSVSVNIYITCPEGGRGTVGQLNISNIHVIICHCRKAADKSAPARQASPPKGPSPRRRPTPPRSPPRRLPSPDSELERSRQRSLQEVCPAVLFVLIHYTAVL